MLTAVIGRLILGVRMSVSQAVRAAWPLQPAMIGAILMPGLLLAGLWGGYALADTITTTAAVGVLVLLYVDLRIRREGWTGRCRPPHRTPAPTATTSPPCGRSAERAEDGPVKR